MAIFVDISPAWVEYTPTNKLIHKVNLVNITTIGNDVTLMTNDETVIYITYDVWKNDYATVGDLITDIKAKVEIVSGGGASVEQIKGTSINFVPTQNSTITGGLSRSVAQMKGIPFDINATVDTTGITFECTSAAASTFMYVALYKYDYANDIWDIATEQMDISLAATGVITSNYSTPQSLTSGKYAICFVGGVPAMIQGFYKLRSTNNFSGKGTSMSGFYNVMTSVGNIGSTMPTQITFDPADFLENLYHEAFQINF